MCVFFFLKRDLLKKKKVYREFPWWSRKISHAAGQLSQMPQLLSPCSRAHVLQLLKPTGPTAHTPHQKKPLQQEVCEPQLESSPCSPQQRPRAAKKQSINNKC